MRAVARVCLMWIGVTLLSMGRAAGQETPADPTPQPVHALSAKQEMVRDRIARLKDRMFRLREKLAESEPQSAMKLAAALEQMGSAGLEESAEQVMRLLADDANLGRASDAQQTLLAELDNVLAVLLARGNNQARLNRIEQLEKHRQDVKKLLDQQEQLRNQTAGGALRGEQARRLAQAAPRLDGIIQRQEALLDPTNAQADAQQRLAEQTRHLGDELAQQAKSADASDSKAPDALKQTAGDIQSGAQQMDAAQQALQNDDRSGAADKQRQALEDLKRARHRLQEAMDGLQKSGPSSNPEAADQQRELSKQAGELAQRMKGGRSGESQPGQSGKQSQGQPGQPPPNQQQPAPGQQNVEQAQQPMNDAGDDLERDDPRQATRNQDQAIEELEQAREKLEEELRQLRQEQQQELLRDLEGRFADMLNRQKVINQDTTAIDGRRQDPWPRAEKLRVAEMSAQQGDLAKAAATCLHILEEEGTTIVFPRIVAQLHQDMKTVADRLSRLATGILTQTIQEEIITTLREILEAVQKMQQQDDKQQQQDQTAPQEDNPPLLPGSAELKLLRAAQSRVNGRTLAIAEAAAQSEESPQDVSRSLQTLANRQRHIADIAREMRDQGE
ncbi:MAG: DUF4175 family protein [Phycisphaerae bacterium]